MAFVHGKGGVFKIDNAAGTLTALTAYVTEWTINQTVETADTTTMGAEAKTYVSGRSDGTLSVSGLYDSTASTGPDVTLAGLIGLETSSTFEVGPEGGVSPKIKYSGECFLTGYEISVMTSDVSKFTADFQVTGAITKGAFRVSLPKIQTAFETVEIGGEMFTVRVLTRAEAADFHKKMQADVPVDEFEIHVIAAATDTPTEEVRAWYAVTPAWAVNELIEHVQRTSRLSEEAQKSSSEHDSAG